MPGETPSKAMEIDVPAAPVPKILYADIAKNLLYIARGVEQNQPRLIQRAIRQNANIRRNVSASQLQALISKRVSPASPIHNTICQAAEKLASSSAVLETTDDKNDFLLDSNEPSNADSDLPELEIYIATLLLTSLLREHLDETAALFSSCLIERVKSFNRRSMDILSSKVFFYFALAFERLNKLEIIRSTLLGLYRTSCLHRDEIGQSVLLNLVLRNYLHYNLFDQAQNFASKAPFPVDISNNQYCRYLYYMGRIQAVQLEYSEASIRLTQALRKAPTSAAHGFLPEVQKLAIIVQLLMGDIPERSVFNQPETKHVLTPYLKLTQAVRNGNMPQFNEVVAAYSGQFKQDDTYTLVQRLGHNVLKIGLRKISIAYSRISFSDIAAKLHLSSASAAEYICSKAIRDGVIDATIDHEQGWVCSNDMLDVYSTQQPMKEFHRRIAFCLDSHNEAVKAMRYPPDAYKKEHMKSTGQKDGGEKSIDEIIKEMEDDDMDDL